MQALWHSHSGPFGMHALAPLVFAQVLSVIPAAPLCHSCRSTSVIRAGPPLSFPAVVSGNPVSFSSVPSFGWPCVGKAMDSRLKTSGMTECLL